jgi:hypothetical protein
MTDGIVWDSSVMGDRKFLQWIHDRLRYVHHENPNVDYMHKLRAVIKATPDWQQTPNVASNADQQVTEG